MSGPLHVRKGLPEDREALFDIWLRSVRATHAFLTEEGIQALIPHVRAYFASRDLDLWILCSGPRPVGFMTLEGSDVAGLFIDPDFHRRGGGRQLIELARALRGELTVEVNEQNAGARRFYEACGFVFERRSETDGDGRPYPLLHLRLAKG